MRYGYSTVADAAELLGVSRQHVYGLIRRGELRAEVIDGQQAIRNSRVAAYQQRTVEPFDHMSVGEVAKRFDRSESTVRDWINRGDLPSIVVKRRRFVPCDAVASFTPRRVGRPAHDDQGREA